MNPLGKVPCLKVSLLQPTICQANSGTGAARFSPANEQIFEQKPARDLPSLPSCF